MRWFAESVPWTDSQWWHAGKDDATACIAPRFGGSDIAEDEIRAYMFGYTEGKKINSRTVVCPNLTPHVEWEPGHCFNYRPGVFPERWRFVFAVLGWMIVMIFFFAIVFAAMYVAVESYPR